MNSYGTHEYTCCTVRHNAHLKSMYTTVYVQARTGRGDSNILAATRAVAPTEDPEVSHGNTLPCRVIVTDYINLNFKCRPPTPVVIHRQYTCSTSV